MRRFLLMRCSYLTVSASIVLLQVTDAWSPLLLSSPSSRMRGGSETFRTCAGSGSGWSAPVQYARVQYYRHVLYAHGDDDADDVDDGVSVDGRINLNQYDTSQELCDAVDADTIKAELARIGLSRGGTPMDRATRLFTVTDTRGTGSAKGSGPTRHRKEATEKEELPSQDVVPPSVEKKQDGTSRDGEENRIGEEEGMTASMKDPPSEEEAGASGEGAAADQSIEMKEDATAVREERQEKEPLQQKLSKKEVKLTHSIEKDWTTETKQGSAAPESVLTDVEQGVVPVEEGQMPNKKGMLTQNIEKDWIADTKQGAAAPVSILKDAVQSVGEESGVEERGPAEKTENDRLHDVEDTWMTVTEQEAALDGLESVAAEIKRLESKLVSKLAEEEEADRKEAIAEQERQEEEVEAARLEQELMDHDRAEKEKRAAEEEELKELERIAAARKKTEEERLEQEGIAAAEKKATKQRREKERVVAEKRANEERMEQERVVAEKKVEEAKLEAQRAAKKKANKEQPEAHRTAADAESKRKIVDLPTDITSEEKNLEEELISLEVQVEAERQRLEQVRFEFENMTAEERAEARRRRVENERNRRRVVDSYQKYQTFGQKYNTPDAEKQKEVGQRLEQQKRAAKRLEELQSSDWKRMAYSYNKYARGDETPMERARRLEVEAELERLEAESGEAEGDADDNIDDDVGGNEGGSDVEALITEDVLGLGLSDAEMEQQPKIEGQSESVAPISSTPPLAAATPVAAPNSPISEMESFRDAERAHPGRHIMKSSKDRVMVEFAWRVGERQLAGNGAKRLESLPVSAFDQKFFLQLHLKESTAEVELCVANMNGGVLVLRNINVYVNISVPDAHTAHAVKLENGGKARNLILSMDSNSLGRCPFVFKSGSGSDVEVTREMLLRHGESSGRVLVYASFEVGQS
mmetsp:Transcript_23612/g.51346  ORF Transcript_23612/g.51346 Transcript_23612/m.51346 type:complete len:927 (-) Transcript_23612:1769-4549(-)